MDGAEQMTSCTAITDVPHAVLLIITVRYVYHEFVIKIRIYLLWVSLSDVVTCKLIPSPKCQTFLHILQLESEARASSKIIGLIITLMSYIKDV